MPPSMPSARRRHVFISRGRDPLGGEREREAGVGVDRRVVPRVAGDGLAVGAGALVDDVLEHGVDAAAGRQPSRSGRCRTCMPRSFITPAVPQNSAWRFQLIGLARSRSLECRNAFSASISSPERAAADRVVGEQGAREVGHLARAADEDVGRRRSPRRSGGRRRGRCRTASRPGSPCRPRSCRGRAARAGGAGPRGRGRRGPGPRAGAR